MPSTSTVDKYREKAALGRLCVGKCYYFGEYVLFGFVFESAVFQHFIVQLRNQCQPRQLAHSVGIGCQQVIADDRLLEPSLGASKAAGGSSSHSG